MTTDVPVHQALRHRVRRRVDTAFFERFLDAQNLVGGALMDVGLVDVSLRDGNQSLWGATGLRTGHVLQGSRRWSGSASARSDYTSSTHMGVAVPHPPRGPVGAAAPHPPRCPTRSCSSSAPGCVHLPGNLHPDTMQLVYDRLVVNGVDRLVVLDPMHDMDALLDRPATAGPGSTRIVGALTYTISAVHDDAFYADLAAARSRRTRTSTGYMKDPAGILTPERARTLIPAVKAALGAMPLELHSHCTIGLSPLTLLDRRRAGRGGPQVGQRAAGQRHVPARRATDGGQPARAGAHGRHRRPRPGPGREYFDGIAAAEELPVGAPQDFDAAFLHHQVAGGVMTTTLAQLHEIGLRTASTRSSRRSAGPPSWATRSW